MSFTGYRGREDANNISNKTSISARADFDRTQNGANARGATGWAIFGDLEMLVNAQKSDGARVLRSGRCQ